MKKVVLFLCSYILLSHSSAQNKTFKSESTMEDNRKFEIRKIARTITISKEQIVISNFIAKKDDLVLIIKKNDKKEFSSYGICKWYYCDRTPKDPINGDRTKYIVIISENQKPDKISVFQVTDEVNVYRHDIFIED